MSFTLVTGAAKNLGKAICLHLARSGENVVVHYKNSKEDALSLVSLCKSFGVLAESVYGDFSTISGVQAFVDAYQSRVPSTKGLVNNVGNYLIKKPQETSVEEMKHLFETNLYAPFLLMQALLPTISKEKGSIVNIGTVGIDGKRAESYSTAYSLTKSSLLMLTRSFAKEYASSQVSINMVSPGILENSIDGANRPEILPMQRTATFEEVAETVFFLLKSPYITGQNLEVAGGIRL
ncbi:MAG TPA: SDR family oxidoreductase [Parachlamydiaceae bacterium]|nr:SDR family oxidoreductase [Parachlamydiaceae bacterium]